MTMTMGRNHALNMGRRMLYKVEYPLLLGRLERLVGLAHIRDSNIAFIALFGSTARFEPGRYSDADVLILVHNQAQFYAAEPTPGVALLWMASQEATGNSSDGEHSGRWPVTAVVSDTMASDLDADFLHNVARDGVELYRQPGYAPPATLAHLTTWERWQRRLKKRLAVGGNAN